MVFPDDIGALPLSLSLGAPGPLLDWLRRWDGGVVLERIEGGRMDAEVRVPYEDLYVLALYPKSMGFRVISILSMLKIKAVTKKPH